MKLIKDYYNNHYKSVNANFNINEYKKMLFREHKDILRKEKKILDIGCGTGFLLKVLENKGFRDITGVELDKAQYSKAKEDLRFSKLFHQDVFIFLERHTEKYDLIFLYDLLEHIEKKKAISLLSKIRKRLTSEGILVIKTPNADAPFFSTRMRYIDFTHEIVYNIESISMVLKEAGFNSIKCRATRISGSYKQFIFYPIRIIGDLILRVYLYTYIGKKAIHMIFEPNFIILAKNEKR